MKLFKPAALLSTALCLFNHSLFALNPVPGWYAGLIVGGTYPSSVNFTTANQSLGLNLNSNLSFNIGADVGGQLGYRCDQFRFEFEGLYNYNGYNKLQIGGLTFTHNEQALSNIAPQFATTTATITLPWNNSLITLGPQSSIKFGGNTQMGAALINGYYDFLQLDNEANIIPYLGVGVGYAYVTNNLNFLLNDVTVLSLKNSHGSAIGQAIIGAQYFMDDTATIGLDYRFVATKGFGLSNSLFSTSGTNLYINTLNITLNYAFEPNLSGT